MGKKVKQEEEEDDDDEEEIKGSKQIDIKTLPIDRIFNTSICFIYVY